jgi:hypothetical protein
MLELVLDRECHNGQYPERVSDWHWQFDARGDNGHYCYYFQFTLRASAAGEAVVDVGPDRNLLPESRASFLAHRPETVWLSRGRDWERYPVAPDAPADGLRIRINLAAGDEACVSRMRPYPYSAVVKRVSHLGPRAVPFTLGQSVEGREIAAFRIGDGSREVLILAGQHPAEFGGTQAVFGIADWLLSRFVEARELMEKYRFTFVPVLNPDGNVGGRCGQNAGGDDLYRSFEGAAGGESLRAPEASALWDWIAHHSPVLSLNFHSFTQPGASGSFPWEGLYTPPDEAFCYEPARERQRRLDDRLAWETDGLSQSGRFAVHRPDSLEYRLATRGVPTVFYEVQDAVGPNRHRLTGARVLQTALRDL